MFSVALINLELDAAEKEARDILEKEGIDPDSIGRHLFSGWPETKIYYSDIGHINPKLSDFGEAAHYAYRMLGVVMLMREVLKECKDNAEFRRMVYSMNLGQFYVSTNVGLNIPGARKFFRVEHNKRVAPKKKGTEGPVKKMIRMIGEKQQAPCFNSVMEVFIKLSKYDTDDQKKCYFPLIILSVDEGREIIEYKDCKTKKEGQVTFKTIKNDIPKIFPSKK